MCCGPGEPLHSGNRQNDYGGGNSFQQTEFHLKSTPTTRGAGETGKTGQFSVFQLSVSLSTEEIGGKRQNANYEFLIYCQKVGGIGEKNNFAGFLSFNLLMEKK